MNDDEKNELNDDNKKELLAIFNKVLDDGESFLLRYSMHDGDDRQGSLNVRNADEGMLMSLEMLLQVFAAVYFLDISSKDRNEIAANIHSYLEDVARDLSSK
ncbi:hypothetical protein [Companilactobacillus insicii]|uniref:hypothetical protein n=1 Tax=Companilactobacillus insicii TaxID=1732567 RepID=UPI000F789A38|nr:hypothetical protein [Companilactobacillus insicii]